LVVLVSAHTRVTGPTPAVSDPLGQFASVKRVTPGPSETQSDEARSVRRRVVAVRFAPISSHRFPCPQVAGVSRSTRAQTRGCRVHYIYGFILISTHVASRRRERQALSTGCARDRCRQPRRKIREPRPQAPIPTCHVADGGNNGMPSGYRPISSDGLPPHDRSARQSASTQLRDHGVSVSFQRLGGPVAPILARA
jgi:hypothetical protein